MSESRATNMVVIGIGGQGALTMMEMLALAAEIAEQEVRVLSRVSLARLGGVGVCHVRLGPCSSSAIPTGEADILLSLEMSEILRILPMARRGARAFVNCSRRLPIAAGVAGVRYPTQEEIERVLEEQGIKSIFVPEHLPGDFSADERIWQVGRTNMLMLGLLCSATELLPRPALAEAIALRLPHLAEQNMQTFEVGWQYAKKLSKGVDNLSQDAV